MHLWSYIMPKLDLSRRILQQGSNWFPNVKCNLSQHFHNVKMLVGLGQHQRLNQTCSISTHEGVDCWSFFLLVSTTQLKLNFKLYLYETTNYIQIQFSADLTKKSWKMNQTGKTKSGKRTNLTRKIEFSKNNLSSLQSPINILMSFPNRMCPYL